MSGQVSFKAQLQQSIDTSSFGAGQWITYTPINDVLEVGTGILKVSVGLSTEEWMEIIQVDTVNYPNQIRIRKRGLSKTVTNPLTEVAGNRNAHYPGASIQVVVYPDSVHQQNTDTGTTQSTFEINSNNNSATLATSGLSQPRTYTFLDRDGQLIDAQYVSDLQAQQNAGDVVGQGLSSDNAITRYSGATGKIIKTTGCTIDNNNNINIPTGSTYRINGSPITATNVQNSTIAPSTNTANNIPQWDGANSRLLKNGLTLATSIGTTGVDTSLPTEKAVRDIVNISTVGSYAMFKNDGVYSGEGTYLIEFDDISNDNYSISLGSRINFNSSGIYLLTGAFYPKLNINNGDITIYMSSNNTIYNNYYSVGISDAYVPGTSSEITMPISITLYIDDASTYISFSLNGTGADREGCKFQITKLNSL